MDLFRHRFEVEGMQDIEHEKRLENTRDLLRLCIKKCGNFQRRELSSGEEQCFSNCSFMLFNDFVRKFYKK